MVPLLQRLTLEKPQSKQRALPRLSAPRWGSVFPHSGIAPRLNRRPAGLPAPQYLRSASGLLGQSDQNQKQKHSGLTAGFLLCRSELAREKPENAAFIQNAHVIVNDLREQARSHIWTVPALASDLAVAFASPHSSRPVGRCALDLLVILILGAPLNQAPKPAFGHTEPKRGAECWGKSPFGYFWGSFPKVTRCKSGTNTSRYRRNGYAPA